MNPTPKQSKAKHAQLKLRPEPKLNSSNLSQQSQGEAKQRKSDLEFK